jgi:phytoene/squalene synthetase
MRAIFDKISIDTSINTTQAYSTSFTMGIKLLGPSIRKPIYAIYGFVRFADEIVDTFLDQDQKKIFKRFKEDTYEAVEKRFSMHPILNSFQKVVNKYNIPSILIDRFLESMEMDLYQKQHNEMSYKQYILGSAEVVGLMCLKIFTNSDQEYKALKPAAMKLGAAFQKVNFLRDVNQDNEILGRTYFPGVDMAHFSLEDKKKIEEDIKADFKQAYEGIKKLRPKARLGVYVAYIYYMRLFNKIQNLSAEKVTSERIRVADYKKIGLLFNSFIRIRLNII